jgi:hypothetical protein
MRGDQTTEGEPAISPLSNEEVRETVEQYSDVLSRSERAFDDSIRTIAAGAVAVTASLTAAFEGSGWSGTLAVAFSIASLFANLLSYWTAGRDARWTMRQAHKRDRQALRESPWRDVTGVLNWSAFFLLLAAGISLVVFVSST